PGSAAPGTSATATRPTHQASPSASPHALSPAAPGIVNLYVWSRERKQWLGSVLTKGNSGFHEGDAGPLMLKVDQSIPAMLYEVQIKFDGLTSAAAAFDYLSSPSSDDGTTGQKTPPGPGRREDASIPIPDDPSIGFDGSGHRLQAWGASF